MGEATQRKIAVLFYNAIRRGMTYQDKGAAAYDERHRRRVLTNLQRHAKSTGYALAPFQTSMLFFRKAAQFFVGLKQ